MQEWNPRYIAYSAAHDKTPDEMLEYDKNRFPGGVMVGFMLWIKEQWCAFARVRGWEHNYLKDHQDYIDFDAWLVTI